MPSLPVRGAWIEMLRPITKLRLASSRSPCGERGLKCLTAEATDVSTMSLPVRGAWIEINQAAGVAPQNGGRSPCGERGLK